MFCDLVTRVVCFVSIALIGAGCINTAESSEESRPLSALGDKWINIYSDTDTDTDTDIDTDTDTDSDTDTDEDTDSTWCDTAALDTSSGTVIRYPGSELEIFFPPNSLCLVDSDETLGAFQACLTPYDMDSMPGYDEDAGIIRGVDSDNVQWSLLTMGAINVDLTRGDTPQDIGLMSDSEVTVTLPLPSNKGCLLDYLDDGGVLSIWWFNGGVWIEATDTSYEFDTEETTVTFRIKVEPNDGDTEAECKKWPPIWNVDFKLDLDAELICGPDGGID